MSRTIPLITSLLLTSCALNEDPSAVDVQSLLHPNGTSITGITVISLTGVAPTGVSATGASISIAPTGAPLSGSALVGSKWTGHVTGGTSVSLRIDTASQGTGANTDVWSYGISELYGSTWRPLCVDSNGVETTADSVRGTWNLSQGVTGGGAYTATSSDFTVACRTSAGGSCLELGYKPWSGHTTDLTACVRALRADFCGDGTSYTVDGTIVNIYDVDGIVPDGVAWTPEAEWTGSGASCVSSQNNTRFYQVAHKTPPCFPNVLKAKISCGTGFAGTTAIITELSPL